VKWKLPPFSPVITIDEINRLPVGKQSTILNEIDRNIWNYRGETLIFKSDKTFFATINYQDAGATALIPPLLDRFDIAVETGRLHPVRKRIVRKGVNDRILQEKKLSQSMIDYILENSLTENADKLVEYVDECREKFRGEIEERFKSRGIKLSIPVKEEIDSMREEISKTDISEDAELLLDYIGQEIYCQVSLKKDFSKCNGCHYVNYICSDLFNISNRAEKSLISYSKALAWLENKEVELEHLLAIMPYIIWHRSSVNDEMIAKVRDFEKDSCDEFYAVNEILNSVKKRWMEHREFQIKAYIFIKNRDYSKAKEIAENINHPFFRSLVREL
jgi:MoxR-like ATPase